MWCDYFHLVEKEGVLADVASTWLCEDHHDNVSVVADHGLVSTGKVAWLVM